MAGAPSPPGHKPHGRTPYEPPAQSVAGQVVDALLMLVLVVITLYLPLLLKLAGGGTTTKTVENPTWESLGQNAVMAAQWEKLDFTPEKAATIIGTRFDYAFNWGAMAFPASSSSATSCSCSATRTSSTARSSPSGSTGRRATEVAGG